VPSDYGQGHIVILSTHCQPIIINTYYTCVTVFINLC